MSPASPAHPYAIGMRRRDTDTARGLPLYLLGSGYLVVPYRPGNGFWECVVLTDDPIRPPEEFAATDAEVVTALDVPIGDTITEPADLWRHRRDHSAHGLVLRLPDTDQCVVPLARATGGWHCLALNAAPAVDLIAEHTAITAASIVAVRSPVTTATPTNRVDLWRHRVQHRFPTATARPAAQLIATLADPDAFSIDLNQSTVRRILDHLRVPTATLNIIVDQFTAAGFLTCPCRRDRAAPHRRVHALTLPTEPTAEDE